MFPLAVGQTNADWGDHMFYRRPLASYLYYLALAGLFCTACQPEPYRRPTTQADIFELLLAHFDHVRVKEHIIVLTSPEFEGRAVGTEGEKKAAAYLTSQLSKWQLEPWSELGLTGYSHEFVVHQTDLRGHNVVAVRPGSSEEWLLLVAHYDHLGASETQVYPGADDNAAAVAILLEVARCLIAIPQAPKRNVAFIFSSGEEKVLSGSKAIARLLQSNRLTSRCRVVNLDMLGGTGGDSLDIWCEPSRPSGKPLASQARHAIEATGLKSNWVRKRFAAVDSRSFARAGIPSITLSWAYEARFHPHRHRPSDTWDQLRPEKLQKAGYAMLRVAWVLANAQD